MANLVVTRLTVIHFIIRLLYGNDYRNYNTEWNYTMDIRYIYGRIVMNSIIIICYFYWSSLHYYYIIIIMIIALLYNIIIISSLLYNLKLVIK